MEESSGLVCRVVELRDRGFQGRGEERRGEERSLSSWHTVISFSLTAGFGGVEGGLY